MDNQDEIEKEYPPIKDLYTFRKVFKPSQEIGIEIEIEGTNLGILPANRTWKLTQDGSLRGSENAEYILYHPIPIKNVEKAIDSLTYMLKKVNAKKELSDRCGVHVHINVQHMTFNEIINYMCLYLVLEPLMVSYCGDSREGNLFCLRAKDAETLIDLLIRVRSRSDMSLLLSRSNTYRYAAMNITSIGKHGSLEFRSLKTPKNFKEIVTWVNLLYCIKQSSYNFETPEQVIDAYSMNDYETFLYRIFKNNAKHLLSLPDINKKLIQGIRLTQDIAYTPVEVQPLKTKEIKKKEVNSIQYYHLNDVNISSTIWRDNIQIQTEPVPPITNRNNDGVRRPFFDSMMLEALSISPARMRGFASQNPILSENNRDVTRRRAHTPRENLNNTDEINVGRYENNEVYNPIAFEPMYPDEPVNQRR